MSPMLKAPPTSQFGPKLGSLSGESRPRRRHSGGGSVNVVFSKPKRLVSLVMSMSKPTTQHQQHTPLSKLMDVPIKVNGCTGKMGKAVVNAAVSVGLSLIPVSFGSAGEAGKTEEVCGKEILVHGLSDKEFVLASVFGEHPNMIVVDYTVLAAVNDNAELYCKAGVPFVMGTTGGHIF